MIQSLLPHHHHHHGTNVAGGGGGDGALREEDDDAAGGGSGMLPWPTAMQVRLFDHFGMSPHSRPAGQQLGPVNSTASSLQPPNRPRAYKTTDDAAGPSPAPLPCLPSIARCITSQSARGERKWPSAGVALHFVDRCVPTLATPVSAEHAANPNAPVGGLTSWTPRNAVSHVVHTPRPPTQGASATSATTTTTSSEPPSTHLRGGSPSKAPTPPDRVASAKAARERAASLSAVPLDFVVGSLTDRVTLDDVVRCANESALRASGKPSKAASSRAPPMASPQRTSTLVSEAEHAEALRKAVLMLTLRFDASLKALARQEGAQPQAATPAPPAKAAATATAPQSQRFTTDTLNKAAAVPTPAPAAATSPKRALRVTNPKWPFTAPTLDPDAVAQRPTAGGKGNSGDGTTAVFQHESVGRWSTLSNVNDVSPRSEGASAGGGDVSPSTGSLRRNQAARGTSPSSSTSRVVSVAKGFDHSGTPVEIALLVTPKHAAASSGASQPLSGSGSPTAAVIEQERGAASFGIQLNGVVDTDAFTTTALSAASFLQASSSLAVGGGASRRPSAAPSAASTTSSSGLDAITAQREKTLTELVQALSKRKEGLDSIAANLQRLLHRQRQANASLRNVGAAAEPTPLPHSAAFPSGAHHHQQHHPHGRRDSVASVLSDSSDGRSNSRTAAALDDLNETLMLQSQAAQSAMMESATSPASGGGGAIAGKGMYYFVASQSTAMFSAINKALGPMAQPTRSPGAPLRNKTGGGASPSPHMADDRVRALLQRAADRCADLADKCRKRSQNTQAIAAYLSQYLSDTSANSSSVTLFNESLAQTPKVNSSRDRFGSSTRNRRSSGPGDTAAETPLLQHRPVVQLADVLPAIAMPVSCSKDAQTAKALKANAEVLTDRIQEVQTKLKLMQSAGGAAEVRRAIMSEYEDKARALPAPAGTDSVGQSPSTTPRAIVAKRHIADEADERRMEALRKSILTAYTDRESTRAVGPPRRGAFSNVRHAEVQNTIEDELAVYMHGRATALLNKERAVTRAFHTVQTCMANMCGYTENIEVELTCQRCWKVFADPHIIAPCGVTVCGACIVATDEAVTSETALECGCTVHEGLVPNDGVTGAVERWAEMDRVATDLVYAMKSLGVGLLPCYSSKTDTVRAVDAVAAHIKDNRLRIASVQQAAAMTQMSSSITSPLSPAAQLVNNKW